MSRRPNEIICLIRPQLSCRFLFISFRCPAVRKVWKKMEKIFYLKDGENGDENEVTDVERLDGQKLNLGIFLLKLS